MVDLKVTALMENVEVSLKEVSEGVFSDRPYVEISGLDARILLDDLRDAWDALREMREIGNRQVANGVQIGIGQISVPATKVADGEAYTEQFSSEEFYEICAKIPEFTDSEPSVEAENVVSFLKS